MLTRTGAMLMVGVIGFLSSNVMAEASGPAPCLAPLNGSFENGFKGWHIVPQTEFTGLAGAVATNSIGDGALFFPPLDEHVAILQCGAQAFGPKPDDPQTSQASAHLSVASAPLKITGRYLTFWTAGGFESLFEGSGTTTFEFHMTVHGAGQPTIVLPISHLKPPPFEDCDIGLSILGTFAVGEPRVVDLFEQDGEPTGLNVGDWISLGFFLSCTASATNSCDAADMGAALVLDDFRFCPQKPGSVPGDVNGDGIVNVDDLLAVVNAWGVCGTCAQDIAPAADPNGIVDVDDLLMVINLWT